jgi:hypothetical protein
MSTGIDQLSDTAPSNELSSALQGKLQKKVDDLRALGLGGTLRKAFYDHLYRTRDYVVTEYVIEPHGPSPDPAEHKDVMAIGPDDQMPDFRRHFGDAKAAETEATIRAGKLCFVVLKDDAVVALCFCTMDDHYEASDQFCFPVRDGEAYFFGHLAPSSQRGFAAYSRLLKFAVAFLSSRGCHRLYATVEPWNLNALGPQLFLGFREAGEILHLRRFLWWSWSTTEPYAGLRYPRYQRRRTRSQS